MAGSKRRFSLSAILLPLLFLTMSGLARAAIITVTNLNDTGAGSLRAAITAHASGGHHQLRPQRYDHDQQ